MKRTTFVVAAIAGALAFALLTGCAGGSGDGRSAGDAGDGPKGRVLVVDAPSKVAASTAYAFDPASEEAAANAPASVSDFLAEQDCGDFVPDDLLAGVDPSSTRPFENVSADDIEAVYLEHPLVGTVEFTDEEIDTLVGTLQVLETSKNKTVASLWVSYDAAYRLYVVGAGGEHWLFDARCDTYSDWLPMVVLYGGAGLSGFDRPAMEALAAVYDSVEARLNAEMPEEMAPFYNLDPAEIEKVEYFSQFEAHTLSAANADYLLDLITQMVIDPRTGTGELPAMAGGSLTGGDASDTMFRLTFTNGASVTFGCRDGMVIGGIRYEGETYPLFVFYQWLFK